MLTPLYVLVTLSYLTNALSSFWRDTPVNWATTILLNPDALEPSASIPFIPQTERKDILNTYGDAPVTVSTSTITVAPETLGFAFRLIGNDGSKYVNWVSLSTSWTFVEIL